MGRREVIGWMGVMATVGLEYGRLVNAGLVRPTSDDTRRLLIFPGILAGVSAFMTTMTTN